MNNLATPNWDDGNSIDLRALLAAFRLRIWWIVWSMILFSVAFSTAAFLIVPVYRASTVLMPASSERGSSGVLGAALGQLGGLASLAGISVGSGDSETEEALAIMRSRQFTEQFISTNDLLPKFFPNMWDFKNKRWKVEEVDQPTLAKGNEYFSKNLRGLIQDKKTGLVTLRIDWTNREEAALWANDLVKQLNAIMRARAIAKTDDSIGYLKKELASTPVVSMQEAINRLIEAQVKQRMLASVTPEYAFRIVDPALPPDIDDVLGPKKIFLLVMGPFVGLFAGVLVVLVVHWTATSSSSL